MNKEKKEQDQHNDELTREITKLNLNLNRLNRRYKYINIIFRSMVTGVFTAIGATIIFGLVVAMLYNTLSKYIDSEWLDSILKDTNIDLIVDESETTGSPTETPVESTSIPIDPTVILIEGN